MSTPFVKFCENLFGGVRMYEKYSIIRDRLGLKDSDVSKGSGVSRSTFSDWKNGKYQPKEDKLEKIANYLGVDISVLKAPLKEDDLPLADGNEIVYPTLKDIKWSLTADEEKLLLAYRGFNKQGQSIIIDQIDTMILSKKYIKNSLPNLVERDA